MRDLINRFDVNGDGELELFEWLEMAAIMFLGADDSEEMNELFKVSERTMPRIPQVFDLQEQRLPAPSARHQLHLAALLGP